VKYAPAIAIAFAAILGFLLLRTGFAIFGWLMIVAIVLVGAFLAWRNRASLRLWWARKTTEWRNDARTLRFWLQLAFARKRDAQATAAMAHQQHFLQGRAMDPVNMIVIATVAVVALPIIGGIQEWRINRVKAERDAPCSDVEVSRNRNGEFRTRRQACSALGATIESALDWRNRAIEAEATLIRDIARIRQENELARIAEMERRERAARTSDRQRRRQNEAITAALGGPSPDLDRSLCELAGRVDCAATGSETGATPTAGPDSVSGESGRADEPAATDPPA
jgi:hypothetical protein